MRQIVRLVCLVVLTGSLISLQTVRVRAEPCDSAEYMAECQAAQSASQSTCNQSCLKQTGGVYGGQESGGVCTWFGEDEPNTCYEDHGDMCGCFERYYAGFCTCDGL